MRRPSPAHAFLLSVLVALVWQVLVPLRSQSVPLAPIEDLAPPNDFAQIHVNGSLLVSDSSAGSRRLRDVLSEVRQRAEALVDDTIDEVLDEHMQGVPGTSIKTAEEASRLQNYLDCVAGQGAWKRDEEGSSLRRSVGGVTVHKHHPSFAACDKRFYKDHTPGSREGWDVRDDLKWTWEPSSTCSDLLPPSLLQTWHSSASQIADLPSRRSLCQLLRHKNILLIGDAATHYLAHDLLLDWTSDTPLTCYGDLFCNEHGICGGTLAEGAAGSDGWERDETVNDRLPSPLGPGHPQLLLKSKYQQPRAAGERPYGTIMRYRRSDGFYLRASPSMPGHEAQFRHPATHVREVNNHALADARRSDLILIYKAPLPLPEPDSYYGNWTGALEKATGDAKVEVALKMAIHMFLETWLPDFLDSLLQLRDAPSPTELLVVYRSGWRYTPDCATSSDASKPLQSPPSLQSLRNAESHVLLHDLQIIIQNHVLRTVVLPRFGIPYLDLETSLSVWRSGYVFGSGTKNCVQPCIPSAGMAVERALIGGLWKVLAWGWAKDEQALSKWTGTAYTPVRIKYPAKTFRRT